MNVRVYVCTRRKLKEKAGRSNVLVFERREEKVTDFNINTPYWKMMS